MRTSFSAGVLRENVRRSTFRELKVPLLHVGFGLQDSFFLPSTARLWTPVLPGAPCVPPWGIVADRITPPENYLGQAKMTRYTRGKHVHHSKIYELSLDKKSFHAS